MNFRIAFALGALLLGSVARLHCQPIILSPEEAMKQGQALVAEILSQRPAVDSTNSGTISIRDRKTGTTRIPFRVEITAAATNWQTAYTAFVAEKQHDARLRVVRPGNCLSNAYYYIERSEGLGSSKEEKQFSGNETMIPFAGSDFWVADLGLEFLNWPTQRLLRKEIRRGQSCAVLESVNPHPAPGAYSRVLSWIDIDTDGIINAEAYDSKGKLLKEFAVTSLKKVRGQMELKGMEIENRQTGSRTTLEFDLPDGK
jgi:hypothetical protein